MVFYDTSDTWWDGPSICVSPHPMRDARQANLKIPQLFVRCSGHNTLQFVQDIVQLLYVEPGRLVNEQGQHIDLLAEPTAWPSSSYRFVALDERLTSFTPVRGPESKSLHPRPAANRSESTYSDSKRTSSRSGQVRFLQRLTLAIR
jgi:hypothetical protein